MLHTVFSVDNSAYLHWQAELLAYSMQKAGQSGAVTRLLSSDEPMSPFRMGHTFQTPLYTYLKGDFYPPRNRVLALSRWLEAGLPEEENILILDPDCVFLAPIEEYAEQGMPIAHPYSYLSPYHRTNLQLLQHHGFRPERIQGMGIPIVIHREDLRAILPLWRDYMEIIRTDAKSRESVESLWVAEMWGYVFASAKLGLWHEMRMLAQFDIDDRVDSPILHYCYEAKDRKSDWQWTKRTYQPWQPVNAPLQGEFSQASVALLQVVNEYSETRRTQTWN